MTTGNLSWGKKVFFVLIIVGLLFAAAPLTLSLDQAQGVISLTASVVHADDPPPVIFPNSNCQDDSQCG